MVLTLRDVIAVLEQMAPSQVAEPWDNPGLQIGYPSMEVRKICLSLDPTIEAVREASTKAAQLLLTHHPLFFQPLKQLNQETYPAYVIMEAFRNDLSIVAAHTNLDASPGGINDTLADLFLLQEVSVLLSKDHKDLGSSYGIGKIGNLPKPEALGTILERVKTLLASQWVRYVGKKNTLLRRMAIVGGSGGNLISSAFHKGADLLLTGDIGHHQALEAKALGLTVIDGGHFHTERTALLLFGKKFEAKLRESGWEVVVEPIEDESDPIHYG